MRVLSGLTPSSAGIHLGNYLGAVQNWIALQDDPDAEALYFIADYHALITIRDRETFESHVRDVALDYLALGLDPQKAILYRQSDVPEVCELTWILTTLTPMGLLERCHAYKDKTAKGISPDHGLFAYPVLMAADILLPRANLVPVGQDQKQHVEVTRDIAGKFNLTYGELFPLPEPKIDAHSAKVPGIDGQKMSKSYGNDIKIFETEKRVRKQMNRIVTDSKEVAEPKEPEGNTVFELYELLAPNSDVEAMAEKLRAGGYGYGEAKAALFECFLDVFSPARARREALSKDLAQVEAVLSDGAERARGLAAETMERVRDVTGIAGRFG